MHHYAENVLLKPFKFIMEFTIKMNSDNVDVNAIVAVAVDANVVNVNVPKKRGRKPKSQVVSDDNTNQVVEPPVAPKKRGRKPKGGKIITELKPVMTDNMIQHNVILHLKCNTNDFDEVTQNSEMPESFHVTSQVKASDLNYDNLNNIEEMKPETSSNDDDVHDDDMSNVRMKNIWKKIKELQKRFYFNDMCSKKSACFWCTCDFDNPSIYIPKNQMNDTYHVYGCFCSPECSVSFLMNENIDTSQKFERYQMLNYIYGKAYNYEKSIQPAPSPYYLLDKFFGNLTIQEYRKLLSNERLLIVIDKPLTRIFPEIHEENNDFVSNKNSVVPSNSSFKIKKRNTAANSKTSSLTKKFGF
uniref:MYM-type domain-containing protein n=1 Tax=viral metagenome TaxID=1070528 RepID=A0A6C0LTI1_9ZZZZ